MESPAKPGFLSDSSPALRNLKAPKNKARDTFRFHLGPRNRPAVWKFLSALFAEKMMEHPDMRHPEFGLLCPPPRLLRELRIAFTFLLIGGVAGALCGSGIRGLHSETASLGEHGSLDSTVGSNALSQPKSQDDMVLGGLPNSESSAAKPEPAAPGAAPPSSAVAPKARVVRIIPSAREPPRFQRVVQARETLRSVPR
jgi:hypothetical protein